jgi:hypothetical protein
MLRTMDASAPAVVMGVPAPENVSALFTRANNLCRALFARYCAVTGFGDLDNRFEKPASGEWLGLSPRQRLARVVEEFEAACLAAGLAPGQAEVAALEGESRVVIRLSDTVLPSQRSSSLFRLERELAQRVEPCLSVEREARRDINQIRRL